MDHRDHVYLLSGGIPTRGGTWADFGSGAGAFTLALADLVGSQATIYSIDRDKRRLSTQQRAFRAFFKSRAAPNIVYLEADFTVPISLPALDGLVMANALHFYQDKEILLRSIITYLKPGGCLILVEYNLEHGNPWVPWPIGYSAWEELTKEVGLHHTRLLARHPSRTMKEIYSAISYK